MAASHESLLMAAGRIRPVAANDTFSVVDGFRSHKSATLMKMSRDSLLFLSAGLEKNASLLLTGATFSQQVYFSEPLKATKTLTNAATGRSSREAAGNQPEQLPGRQQSFAAVGFVWWCDRAARGGAAAASALGVEPSAMGPASSSVSGPLASSVQMGACVRR